MFGSDTLDVAIGMIFIFLLLSLIASTLHEIGSGFLQARSANLHRALLSLFSEDGVGPVDSMVEKLYDHGLIRGLYQDHARNASDPLSRVDTRGGLNRLRAKLQSFLNIAPSKPLKCVTDPLSLPAYIPARTFALAVMDVISSSTCKNAEMSDVVTYLSAKAANNKAFEAMHSLALNAGKDFLKFQTNLEGWYNDSMDRASGWYKKNTQHVLLLLGFVIAVTLNVDSLKIGETLYSSRDARQAMVNAAQKYDAVRPREDAAPETPSATDSAAAPGDSSAAATKHLEAEFRERVSAFQNVNSEKLLPIGWTDGFPPQAWGIDPREWTWKAAALIKLMGWIITAVAISLGAPFWFDILNKFMVVRNTIKPQEKSQTDASKDGATATAK